MGGEAARIDAGTDFSEIRAQLERAVRRTCPPWLSEEAEDIVQIALIRVTQKVRAEGNPTLVRSYLWKVGYTATIDAIRRARRKREVSLDASQSPIAETSTEQHTAAVRLGEAVRDCLARLPDDRARAVSLYLLGHRLPEIAQLMGWKTKRAENLVYRGLPDLRTCLENKGMRP